ncbi:MAG: DUF4364 family protein [Ruminococcaceae bacterium]|nr:DUF4364 family protein [Oscillospiraceae bacterium]
MTSPIGSKRNVKIFVLYLMQNIGYPLDYITVNDIIMQTDYVMFLDFAEAFRELEDDALIEKMSAAEEGGDELYAVTRRGMYVAEQLKSEILPSLLDQSLECALRYLDFKKRGVKVSCNYEKLHEGGYNFRCKITEKEKLLMEINLWVDSENRAKRMEEQFRGRPETVYKSVNALLSGNVNYLWD